MEEAWLFLIAACILEPIWMVCPEKSDNFRRRAPSGWWCSWR